MNFMCIEMPYFTYHRGHLTREFVYFKLVIPPLLYEHWLTFL